MVTGTRKNYRGLKNKTRTDTPSSFFDDRTATTATAEINGTSISALANGTSGEPTETNNQQNDSATVPQQSPQTLATEKGDSFLQQQAQPQIEVFPMIPQSRTCSERWLKLPHHLRALRHHRRALHPGMEIVLRMDIVSTFYQDIVSKVARMLTGRRERELVEGINKRLSGKMDKKWKKSIVVRPPPSLKKIQEEEAPEEAKEAAAASTSS